MATLNENDFIIDIRYDPRIRMWRALLLDYNEYQHGDTLYEGNLQSIMDDAYREWGELRMYKDITKNGYNKPLN